MNIFVPGILEIYLFDVRLNSQSKTKFVYNEKRALLNQGCHMNICNRRSNYLIRVSGGSSP